MQNKNHAKSKIKQLIIEIIEENKDQVIKQIINQKKAMFDSNTHSWHPLLSQTIERKKREKNLFREPETINIRKGGLFKTFITQNQYNTRKSGNQLDFNIELDDFSQFKVNTVAKHGRNVIELTQNEIDQIVQALIEIIITKLKTVHL